MYKKSILITFGILLVSFIWWGYIYLSNSDKLEIYDPKSHVIKEEKDLKDISVISDVFVDKIGNYSEKERKIIVSVLLDLRLKDVLDIHKNLNKKLVLVQRFENKKNEDIYRESVLELLKLLVNEIGEDKKLLAIDMSEFEKAIKSVEKDSKNQDLIKRISKYSQLAEIESIVSSESQNFDSENFSKKLQVVDPLTEIEFENKKYPVDIDFVVPQTKETQNYGYRLIYEAETKGDLIGGNMWRDWLMLKYLKEVSANENNGHIYLDRYISLLTYHFSKSDFKVGFYLVN